MGSLFKIRFSQVWEAEQPKNGLRQLGEDAEPGPESGWLNLNTRQSFAVFNPETCPATHLVQLVEITENDRVIR
jgi:hypothetical protein